MPPRKELISLFLRGVEQELEMICSMSGNEDGKLKIDTIFWGGGTPGLLGLADTKRLLNIVGACCQRTPQEWTIELTPASVKPDKVEALLEGGVNRFSIGAQSFQPRLMQALGRRHAPGQTERAMKIIRAAGGGNINLDFIFSIPGQTVELWREDLRHAVSLEPQHISTYCLTCEEDTPLSEQVSSGAAALNSPETEADFLLAALDTLSACGFQRYETSNYCRKDFSCIHNINTWSMQEWIGVGPAAASQFNGWRYANPASLERWMSQLERGQTGQEDRQELTPELLAADTLIFGLRMDAGVDLREWRRRFPGPAEDCHRELAAFIEELELNGLARRCGSLLRLTRDGSLLADAVGQRLLEIVEQV